MSLETLLQAAMVEFLSKNTPYTLESIRRQELRIGRPVKSHDGTVLSTEVIAAKMAEAADAVLSEFIKTVAYCEVSQRNPVEKALTYTVCANADQVVGHVDFGGYSWKTTSSKLPNRVETRFDNKADAVILYEALKQAHKVAFRNWLD